ncbi:MAG: undecaprenyldiphospho-muramoylpentapeptide beta-N-acetylglucosaminyltransferase [Eubacteriales bacterium]|nr:undecaprenyldiphospho-muramoylpentapeptide beta-N-acetylglucosaminyltransferase [Eubacteriales bacterium]
MSELIILTGGGSAGHVTPNLALAPVLRARGYRVEYIGSRDGMERELVSREGIPYHGISTGKLRRYFDMKNFSDPFRVVAGVGQARQLLKEMKPAAVFAKGGFVSVPVAMAAHRLRIPLVLHESDLTPGLANKIMLRWADRVCTTFPEAAQALGDKAVHTGTPMRQTLFSGNRADGLARCGFTDGKPTLLMTGGSLGAQAINEALRQALPSLTPRFNVIHLCGKGKLDKALVGTPGYYQCEYATDEMKDFLAAADLVLSRAGSNAIYELLALKKPMLLIPLPLSASRGDQILNAQSFEKQGFAKVLPQEELTPASLVDGLTALWAQKGEITTVMAADRQSNAVEKVADVICQAAGKA